MQMKRREHHTYFCRIQIICAANMSFANLLAFTDLVVQLLLQCAKSRKLVMFARWLIARSWATLPFRVEWIRSLDPEAQTKTPPNHPTLLCSNVWRVQISACEFAQPMRFRVASRSKLPDCIHALLVAPACREHDSRTFSCNTPQPTQTKIEHWKAGNFPL